MYLVQYSKLISSVCSFVGVGAACVQRVRLPQDQLTSSYERREAARHPPVEQRETKLQRGGRDETRRSFPPYAAASQPLAAVLPGGWKFAGHQSLHRTHLHPHCDPVWRGRVRGGSRVTELC